MTGDTPARLAARLGCDPAIFTAGWDAARDAGPVAPETVQRVAGLMSRSTTHSPAVALPAAA